MYYANSAGISPDDVSIALDDPENEEDLEFLGRGNSM